MSNTNQRKVRLPNFFEALLPILVMMGLMIYGLNFSNEVYYDAHMPLVVSIVVACIIGCIGVFVPVLPTTPLLLLATFLFAKSSPRCHAWIISTRVYRTYVAAFKEAGGIPLGTKVRILAVSFTLMGLSAWFVQKPLVWAILGCVSAFLLYLMFVRIPTITPERVQLIRQVEKAE